MDENPTKWLFCLFSPIFEINNTSTSSTHPHAHIFHFANPSVENMWEAHFNCRVIRSYTNTIEAVASKIAAAIKNEVRPLWNRTLGRGLSYTHTHTQWPSYIHNALELVCLFMRTKRREKVRFICTYMLYSFSADAIVIYNKQHITRLVFISSDRIERVKEGENLLFDGNCVRR